jgi:hypothetical protein
LIESSVIASSRSACSGERSQVDPIGVEEAAEFGRLTWAQNRWCAEQGAHYNRKRRREQGSAGSLAYRVA